MLKKFLNKIKCLHKNKKEPEFIGPSKEDCFKLIKTEPSEWNKLKSEHTGWIPNLDELNFENIDLFDVDLKNCSLIKADFSKTINLREKNLGGSDLNGAKLPEKFEFTGLKTVTELSVGSSTIFITIIFLCFYCWLTVFSTNDLYLLTNSSKSTLPIINVPLDITGFYIAAPLLLLAFYLYFQFNLRKLWREFSELPAYFPDGKAINQKSYSWLTNDLVINYMRLLKNEDNIFLKLQNKLIIFLVWGIVPITILAIWIKYLISHNLILSSIHSLLLSFCLILGIIFFQNSRLTLQEYTDKSCKICDFKYILSFTLLASFLILIAYINSGEHLYRDRYGYNFYIGYHYKFDPGTEITKKPDDWTDIEKRFDSLPQILAGSRYDPRLDKNINNMLWKIKGIDLSNKNLVGINAINSFLVNANLSNTNLSCSILVGSYFQHANLEKAHFDAAQLWGANFKKAYLDETSLKNAVLRETNFQSSILSNTNFRNADLTDADLQNADLSYADLSAANLSGVNFKDSCLFFTNLSNTILEDTEGLTYEQLLDATIDENTILPVHLLKYRKKLLEISKENAEMH